MKATRMTNRKSFQIPLFICCFLFLAPAVVTTGWADDPAAYGPRCIRDQLKVYESMAQPVDPGDYQMSDGMTPPPDPGLGDSWDWYIWHLAGYPTATLESCTIRGVGDNVYVVVEDSRWNVHVNQEDVDLILEHFDNSSVGPYPTQGIWDLNTSHFGFPPDPLDNDPRIYILYYDFDVSSDGFFWIYDQYPDGTQPFASNECEVIYLSCAVSDPGGDYLTAVAAHEFEHMIHHNYDTNESSWVDEGCAELAMWLYGNPDNIVGFNSVPDNNLSVWNGTFSDYIKTYLWTLYFFERYGGQVAINNLVQQPGNGIPGYEAVLDAMGYTENFADVFSDWVVANYVDDETLLDGRFGYSGESLPVFTSILRSSYPAGPYNAAVQHWAADYVKFINGEPLGLLFNGLDSSTFAARVVTYSGGLATGVQDLPLDENQDGLLDFEDFGGSVDQLVLVAANLTSGTGSVTYSYATTTPADVADLPAAASSWLTAAPNPLRPGGALRFQTPRDVSVQVELYDAAGRRVWSWAREEVSAGIQEIPWDGRASSGALLAPGYYFARMRAGGLTKTSGVVVIN